MGLNRVDERFDARLRKCFDDAIKKGLWKGTYAAVNHNEYWAEGVQSWFDDNRENDSLHNHVNTRAELKEYDPGLAAPVAKSSVTSPGAI
jgi:alpha-glucosidase